ncbi:unnamed protein product, partial [Rotaria magnacalcarata]
EHTDILEETICQEEAARDPNIDIDTTSILACNDTDLGTDSEIHDMEDVENEEEEDTDADDIICWSSFKEIWPLLLEKNKDLDSFEKFYLQFLLDLREGHSLPKYSSYESAKEIKLDNPNEVAYYVPIHYSIQQMLSNPHVLDILIKNFNQIINQNAHDTDLMFDYRHASQAKLHPVLKNKPDSLLFQLYVDEIGLTNPIGAKKDTQKVTMLYVQLADLPDTVKSMVNQLDFWLYLNTLQTSGIFIPALRTQLNFAFTILAGDNLGSNDIGGFQKNFNNGQFCRHCHINYDQRLIPLSEISHPHRTRDQHDNLVQQVINLNNDFILQGVVDVSPFSKLIGFHATTSLPNYLMHNFNEGVCGQILLAMIKETSTKRILSFGEIEERLMSFEYGLNDKPNKGPTVRKKHLNKGKIVGTASQKMCLFKLFPIIFHEIIDLLVYASPFRKSWLPYLHSLTVRFQCLIVHILPNVIIPKVHFITHYAKQIEMYGPSIQHWCMRFESKHKIFKQLAAKFNNFKNILYTLSKRHQLRQCLFLSLPNYYKMVREGYSATEKDVCTLPADVREDIDGETLFNLPQSIMYEIIKTIKERVRFLAEHRTLFHDVVCNDSDPIASGKYIDNSLNNDYQQVIEQRNTNQFTTMSTIPFSNNNSSNGSVFDSSTDSGIMTEETTISSNEDDEKGNKENQEQPRFPDKYIISDLPPKIQQFIDKGEINHFRGHSNVRRLLLDAIFTDVTTKYSLLYPDTHEYRSIGIAILEKLNTSNAA